MVFMYKECYSALKRKKILTHAYSETLRTFHGVEYASHGKTNPAQSHFLEVLGVLRTGEEDGGGRCQRKGTRLCLMGTEFQFCKMKSPGEGQQRWWCVPNVFNTTEQYPSMVNMTDFLLLVFYLF